MSRLERNSPETQHEITNASSQQTLTNLSRKAHPLNELAERNYKTNSPQELTKHTPKKM